MRKLIILTVIFIASLNVTYACSCFEFKPVKEEIDASDVVFIGEVLMREFVASNSSNKDADVKFYRYTKYTVKVTSSYKGIIKNDTLLIYTGLAGLDCGSDFEVNKTYIIYGNENRGYNIENDIYPTGQQVYWTSRCKRNILFNKKEIELIERSIKN